MAYSLEKGVVPDAVKDQIRATIYGQCIGDALGLLTEFMIKREAKAYYGDKVKDLRYDMKVPDFHRQRWKAGDWTDDSDQMILILHSLLYNKGEVNLVDFAKRMKFWMLHGFPDHGDLGGLGIGKTTSKVLCNKMFTENPEEVSKNWYDNAEGQAASNGGVMRTSIVGLHQWRDVTKVEENSMSFCKTTHYDPRCQASVVAVTTCIALMLQHTEKNLERPKPKKLNLDKVIKASYEMACKVLATPEEKKTLWWYMSCSRLKALELCEFKKIGFTYKCMGCGFWALRQNNFKKAMTELVMEAGDADTNASVAGAMLGCKLGLSSIPQQWISDLIYKDLLDNLFERFITLQTEMEVPLESRTSHGDLDLEKMEKDWQEWNRERERQIDEERKKREKEESEMNLKAKEENEVEKPEDNEGEEEKENSVEGQGKDEKEKENGVEGQGKDEKEKENSVEGQGNIEEENVKM